MAVYDRHDFDKSIIPSHLKKDVRQTIEVAVAVGWELHVAKDNSCTLIAPDGHKKHHFGAGSRTTTPINRIRRDVFRHGDQRLIEQADAVTDGKFDPKNVLGVDVEPEAGSRSSGGQRRRDAQTGRFVEPKAPSPADMPQHKAEAEVQPESSVTELRVVSEQPMLAKATEGRAYESQSAIERKWSDGSVDYKCSKCEYTSTKRLGIRGHFQIHSRGHPSPQPQTHKAEVPDAVRYKPRQSRIDALASVINDLINNEKELDPQALARTALTWVHEQSKSQTHLAAEHEELTDADVLARIRNLLDDGSYLRQREQIEAMQAELTEAKRRAERAEAQAESARQTLKTFTDLATEQLSSGQQQEDSA